VSQPAQPTDYRALFKRALETLEDLKRRLAASERARTEPIAVIGMSCRLPGQADDPEAFWRLLREGRDAVSGVPRDRWDADAYYDPDPDAPGKMYTREGAFLGPVDRFDAAFFGIAPREAMSLDPQQRLLLEVAWEALEDAGKAPDRLGASRTGVFVGISGSDYAQRTTDARRVDPYTGTGSAPSVAAGRLSYLLGLQGPSLAVDTACSSSLVAVHLAVQSLRARHCSLALAGGVNLMLSPGASIYLSKLRALAPDGRCRTFARGASGYSRGEGCGVVVLKRLSEALAEGERILAVIRGAAVNHDGRSGGLTVPNGAAQQAVIRDALADAGVEPADVAYVEAHGTGTPLGDPIEVRALAEVLCPGRDKSRPLLVGSAKTNVAHLEAAAGIAGLIKAVLCLVKGEIPPHLHFEDPSPHIEWDQLALEVPTALRSWPPWARRVVGVSSFGFSGTNAHVVLEAAPLREVPETPLERPLHALTLSARSESALRALAGRYVERLGALDPAESFADACHTAGVGRASLPHRCVVVAATGREAAERLARFRNGGAAPSAFSGELALGERVKVAYLFTGQGSQYAGMGRGLFETQPLFRQSLLRCDEILRPHLPRSLLSVLYPAPGEPAPIDETLYTQPALFAVEWALAEVLQSWGVRPAAVLGHSVGEYVAACVAGVFSVEDGLKLVAERARLMQALPEGGAMAAVFASEAQVAAVLGSEAGRLSIAAVNGPEDVVVSGDGEALRAFCERLTRDAIRSRRLSVSHAFHSPLVEPILGPLHGVASAVRHATPSVGLITNLTGKPAQAGELGAEYWVKHARGTVRFAESVQALVRSGYDVFVELGPSPTLSGLGRRCVPEHPGLWVATLRKGKDDWDSMLPGLAQLWVRGVDVDWAGFDRGYGRRKLPLPSYPFERERYWLEQSPPAAPAGRAIHPLLQRRVRAAQPLYESALSSNGTAYLREHTVLGKTVFPLGGFLEMALAAGARGAGAQLEDVTLEEPLVLGEEERLVQISIARDGAVSCFSSHPEDGADEWRPHFAGRLRAWNAHGEPGDGLAAAKARCREALAPETLYADLQERGVAYGEALRAVEAVWRGDGEALARVALPEALVGQAAGYRAHPVLIEAGLQILEAVRTDAPGGGGSALVAQRAKRFALAASLPTRLWASAQVRSLGDLGTPLDADLRFFDDSGACVGEIEQVQLRRTTWDALERATPAAWRRWLYELRWQEQPLPEPAASASVGGVWVLFADATGLAARLRERLEARGEACITALPGPGYRSLGEGRYELDPTRPDDFRRLLADLSTAGGRLRGAVHLAALGAEAAADPLRPARAACLGAALHLAQALLQPGNSAGMRLCLVTRGAQAVAGSDVPAPAAAALWGLGHTIPSEHPELDCRCVDLDPGDAGLDALERELDAGDGEDAVAYRGGRRYVARLLRAVGSFIAAKPATVRSDATYLVTGGLGALGLRLAEWLTSEGARHLALVGRRAPGAAARAAIDRLQAAGAEVRVCAADVSDATSVQRLFAELHASWPPLRGMVHAAGVLDDGAVLQQSWERFERVLAAKVDGAWNLHVASQGLDLDWFVLFSSAASLFGAAGQSNYAAANAVLDALAGQRRARGLPGLSVNWGPWAEVGMATLRPGDEARRAEVGIGAVAPAQGLKALAQLLRADGPQFAVLSMDWARLARGTPRLPRLVEQLASAPEAPEAGAAEAGRAALDRLAPEAREEWLRVRLREHAGRVLQLPASRLDFRDPLTRSGLDSLMAVELRNRTAADLGVAPALSSLLGGASLAELAAALHEQLERGAALGDAEVERRPVEPIRRVSREAHRIRQPPPRADGAAATEAGEPVLKSPTSS